ncbi:carboxypeptidase-like regulatory domain-containing protein [Niabella beijingensis]|uniref:carboxypeptidase-like regulatory domain-containing protein n=1 Tax=Niabella beijingensis TaxID=2872700 RepID=UPI001CBD5127|nr:carboxypeptidase-like regulatory domain-containing protein [Niabella beijingensis]MBZ4189395.1 carboxypeptidase-like regulatory domain-containing protein [Niabella beijingensis]
MLKEVFTLVTLLYTTHFANAQYTQPEKDDTIRLYAKTPFDSLTAKKALAEGTGTIKGQAFTRPRFGGYPFKFGAKILANKITVLLFPVTPYLLDYLQVKKKENRKKLKYAYIDETAFRYRLTAVTNSDGEFTFPKMKPGKYYLEAILPWSETKSYDAYTGTGYGMYSTVNYYETRYYNQSHYDKLTEFVEVKAEGEVLHVKLK